MKALLRSLLLWFLLAAVPFGGFASATMLLCGPQSAPQSGHATVQHAITEHAMQADGHHDEAMLAARHEEGGHHGGADAGHAGHAKCASTGACCIGAPLAPALPAAPALGDASCATVPFVPAAPAAVDLAGLERPPKTSPA